MMTRRMLVLVLLGMPLLPTATTTPLFAQTASMEMHAGAASVPSTSLTLTGLDGKTVILTAAELKAIAHKSLTVMNEHTKVEETYSGVPLAELLTRVSAPVGAALKGKAFLQYLLAEGTDHYRVVYSLTEVDPANHSGDVIVADTLNGVPLTTDGAFKLVGSEDKRPARWVRNLTAITVRTAE